ncbi:MAG TPA: lysophospholipid acyltransferase family protein [Candidatus Sulfotelmatobacter sp.]|nr:lysophospholipid acyltransferase family protein [Candidatus Sulfotelmatobacter sp.]
MNFSYRCGWIFFRAVFAIYFRWRVFGAENVPKTGGVILAANHASYVDPPVVGAGLDRAINYLARQSLFRFPIIGRLLLSWNAVPVDRDGGGAKGLKIILDRLLGGAGIILFPEGTRSYDGKLQPAQPGIGLTVAKSDAPVVPVRVFGTYEAWGRNRKVPLPKRITVRYGEPMRFEKLRAEAKDCSRVRLKEIYQQIADEIMAAIAALRED